MPSSATRWQPGQSGNPKGTRPEILEVRQVRKLAQEKTVRAFQIVAGLMESAEKDSVRLAAAIAVLKIAGVRLDGEVNLTLNQPAALNPLQTMPTGKLLEMKVTSPTPSPTSSGEEGS
jgi:hypothetical protein